MHLPTPDFSAAPLRCVAGLRPYRAGSYRLERDPGAHPGKLIVHNYGYGGGGITVSWGCANRVGEIVQALASPTDKKAAVLGSGVIGMTTATLLLEHGFSVTVYAEKTWDQTTSSVAGGQWSPTRVEFTGKQEEFKGILKYAYTRFRSSIGQGFGVSERPNYFGSPSLHLDTVMALLPGMMPPRKQIDPLPFEHHTNIGYVYQTLLVEPPIFLARLDRDLRANNVQFVSRKFSSVADVLSLQENIIVNCTGLGSKNIWPDKALKPIKGQLALLPPQPQLQYLYGQNGYMFPRTDAVVIGGSYETDFTTAAADPPFCQLLVDYMKGLFGKGPVIPIPVEHVHHPSNAPNIAAAGV
jgi:D-amino-acid oxidase